MEIFSADRLSEQMGLCKIIRVVAAGDNAVVVTVIMNGHTEPLALKIITNGAGQGDILKETNIQIYASENGIAPRVFGYTSNIWEYITNREVLERTLAKFFPKKTRSNPKPEPAPLQGIVMQIIQPIWFGGPNRNTITELHQQQLVSKTWRMVQLGIIHNDLHQGNVGILNGEACIYDFGEAEIINVQSVPLPPVVMRQLLVSQLYSLLTREGCNHNNNIDLCGDNMPIHDAIYFVKSHTNDDLTLLNNMIKNVDINPPVATFNTYTVMKKNNK
jgi:predicted Ser/Thr protein kinase